MKTNVIIVLCIIAIGILVGIVILFSLPKETSNYEKILEAANSNYEVNITYSYKEEDILSFDGIYNLFEGKTKISDDEETYDILGNIYSYFMKYLENQNYDEKEYYYVVSLEELRSSDSFYTFLKENSLSYICTYNFFDNKILGIDCINDNANFTIDFYFD